jgi:protein TonB
MESASPTLRSPHLDAPRPMAAGGAWAISLCLHGLFITAAAWLISAGFHATPQPEAPAEITVANVHLLSAAEYDQLVHARRTAAQPPPVEPAAPAPGPLLEAAAPLAPRVDPIPPTVTVIASHVEPAPIASAIPSVPSGSSPAPPALSAAPSTGSIAGAAPPPIGALFDGVLPSAGEDESSTRATAPFVDLGRTPRRYPPEALSRGEEGAVVLEVQILADGTLGTIRVVKDPGYPSLVAAAIQAVHEARIDPARDHGRPVATAVLIPFEYRIHR